MVEVRVQIIAASRGPGGVDPKLGPLERRLRDFAFTSYRVLSDQTLILGLNSEDTLALPDNRSLEITPRKFERSGKIRVHLHLRNAKQVKLVDAEYAIEPGGDLLVGGMKHADGSLLIALHHNAAHQPLVGEPRTIPSSRPAASTTRIP
jgi:hypothetical protein